MQVPTHLIPILAVLAPATVALPALAQADPTEPQTSWLWLLVVLGGPVILGIALAYILVQRWRRRRAAAGR